LHSWHFWLSRTAANGVRGRISKIRFRPQFEIWAAGKFPAGRTETAALLN
jgi:hypothetical protein